MYINRDDLKKGLRAEVLDTITRSNEEVVYEAIKDATTEISSYLDARYDILAELTKEATDTDRVQLVVKLVRDMAIYNCYMYSAQVNMPDSRQRSYDSTIKYLKEVQAEKASIAGLTRKTTADGTTSSNYLAFGGNAKRDNHM